MSDSISVTLPNGQVASKLVNMLVSNRPANTSRKSIYPYYRESYALWIRPSIDLMIEKKQDLVFAYNIFCTPESGISPNTLYMRINQAIKYLTDYLDTENKYKNWQSMTSVERSPSRQSVIISYRPEFCEGTLMKPTLSEPLSAMPVWRRQLDAWIESDSSKPFCVEGLLLTFEQVKQLNTEFAGVKGLLCSITNNSIKIIRTL